MFLLLRVVINYHMCICGSCCCLYDSSSSSNGWLLIIIILSLLLSLFNFIKVRFSERRKWKRCWPLKKSFGRGRDVAIKFFISMDILQHTNETITNL